MILKNTSLIISILIIIFLFNCSEKVEESKFVIAAKKWAEQDGISYEEIVEKENWRPGNREAKTVKKLKIHSKIGNHDVYSILEGGLGNESNLIFNTDILIEKMTTLTKNQIWGLGEGPSLVPLGDKKIALVICNVNDTDDGLGLSINTMCEDIEPKISDIRNGWLVHLRYLNKKIR